MAKHLSTLLLLSLSVYAQTSEGLGGTGGAGGQIGYQATSAPQLQITTGNCPNGTLGVPNYLCQITAVNGVGALSFSISSGSLPNGFTLSGSGLITGTALPNAATYSFTVKVTDSATPTPNTATQPLSIVIVCPPISLTGPLTLPPGQQGSTYSYTFPFQGGVSPFTFSPTGTALPGETLNSSGVLSGTPTQAGNFSFPVTVSDSCNTGTQSASATYSEQVNTNIAVVTSSLPNATVQQLYQQTLTVSGGTSPYTWKAQNVALLPPGITISASGLISGTPTVPGVYNFTAVVTDSLNNQATANLSITVNCLTLVIASQSPLPSCTATQSYNFTMTANPAGAGALTWSAPGLASIGLAIAPSTGVISGTCTNVGTLNATISVTDSCPVTQQTASGLFSITVHPNVAPMGFATASPLNSPVVGSPFTQQIVVTGGVAPYAITSTAGSFPPGITMPGTAGLVQGTAATPATSSTVTIQAVDSNSPPTTISQAFSITSICPALTINTSSIAPPTEGSPYSAQINASGFGTLAFSAAGLSGTGLSINPSTGLISGTPTSSGSFTVVVSVTDSCTTNAVQQTYTLVINSNLAIVTGSLPNGTVSSAYSATITGSGGTTPYSFAITTGAAPAGLALATTGILSGTPTTVQTVTFTVTLTDAHSNTATKTYTVSISAATGCGPPAYKCSRTDVNVTPLPAVPPAFGPNTPTASLLRQTGNLLGAGTCATDIRYNNAQICRVTDANLPKSPTAAQGYFAGLGGSGDSLEISLDNKYFRVENSGGGGIMAQLNTATMQPSLMPCGVATGVFCVMTNFAPQTGVFSSGTNSVFYSFGGLTTADALVHKWVLTSSGPSSETTVADFANALPWNQSPLNWTASAAVTAGDYYVPSCNNAANLVYEAINSGTNGTTCPTFPQTVPSGPSCNGTQALQTVTDTGGVVYALIGPQAISYTDVGGVDLADNIFLSSFANYCGQGTAMWGVAYIASTNTYYNVNSATGYGFHYVCSGGTGVECTGGSFTKVRDGQLQTTANGFYIHNVKASKSGAYLTLAYQRSTVAGSNTTARFWFPITPAVTLMTAAGACGFGGHWANECTHILNQNNATSGSFWSRLASSPNTCNTFWSPPAPQPATDTHIEALFGGCSDNGPVIGSADPSGGNYPPITAPYQDELFGFSTDGTNKQWRFAQAMSTHAGQSFSGFAGIGQGTSDGALYFFTSDMLCTLGNTNGGGTSICGLPWQPNFGYSAGTMICPHGSHFGGNHNAGDFCYTIAASCVSGKTEPAWNQTVGQTTADNTCIDTNAGVYNARYDVFVVKLQ